MSQHLKRLSCHLHHLHQIKRNVLLGAILGGFVAIVAVLVREVLDDRIRRPEDVEDVLEMTLLGIVPDTDKI